MSVVSFSDLQEMSGCKQTGKVVKWLQMSKIPHVIGNDGKPRTTQQWLDQWLERGKQNATTQVRFKV